MAGILIDTNVLVYAHDRREPQKQRRAIEVLAALHAGGGQFSAQTLAEFYHSVTKGAQPMLREEQAEAQVAAVALSWPVIALTPAIVLEATRGRRLHRLNYWDAQIWAAARLHQCGAVFSEDLNPGAVLEGVRFVNPFAPEFQLSDWE